VLVVQSDLFNATSLNTVVVVALTSNARLAELPGNVALAAGEANLPRPCCANVTQVVTLDRRRLVGKVGSVGPDRLRDVMAGLDLVLRGAR
jgi:mRNA interferase MazF